MAPVCCICEREQGEDYAELSAIHTPENVVLICDLCQTLAGTHAFIKCRHCGAVATIRKDLVPGGFALQEHTFIIFSEGCRFCSEEQCRAKSAMPN